MKLLIGLHIMRLTLTAFMTQAVVSLGDGPGSPHAHAKTIALLSQDEGVGSPPAGATNKHQASSKDSPGSSPALAKTNVSEDSTCSSPPHAKLMRYVLVPQCIFVFHFIHKSDSFALFFH